MLCPRLLFDGTAAFKPSAVFDLPHDLFLSFIKEQLFVVRKIALAAEPRNILRRPEIFRQFRDKQQDLLPLAERRFQKNKRIGKRLPRRRSLGGLSWLFQNVPIVAIPQFDLSQFQTVRIEKKIYYVDNQITLLISPRFCMLL